MTEYVYLTFHQATCYFLIRCESDTASCHGPFGASFTPVNYSPSTCITYNNQCYFCEYGAMLMNGASCTCSNYAACNMCNIAGVFLVYLLEKPANTLFSSGSTSSGGGITDTGSITTSAFSSSSSSLGNGDSCALQQASCDSQCSNANQFSCSESGGSILSSCQCVTHNSSNVLQLSFIFFCLEILLFLM